MRAPGVDRKRPSRLPSGRRPHASLRAALACAAISSATWRCMPLRRGLGASQGKNTARTPSAGGGVGGVMGDAWVGEKRARALCAAQLMLLKWSEHGKLSCANTTKQAIALCAHPPFQMIGRMMQAAE